MKKTAIDPEILVTLSMLGKAPSILERVLELFKDRDTEAILSSEEYRDAKIVILSAVNQSLNDVFPRPTTKSKRLASTLGNWINHVLPAVFLLGYWKGEEDFIAPIGEEAGPVEHMEETERSDRSV